LKRQYDIESPRIVVDQPLKAQVTSTSTGRKRRDCYLMARPHSRLRQQQKILVEHISINPNAIKALT
jgi:hypothetical protein